MSDDSVEVKVILLGDSGVGKTCIVHQAISGTFADTTSTLGASYSTKSIHVLNTDIQLQIWDTAGQETYRGMVPIYFRGAKVILLVFALNNVDSFNNIDDWMKIIKESADEGCVLILIGNKEDLVEERTIPSEDLQEKAEKIKAHHSCEISALTGNGINDLFNNVGKLYLENSSKGSVKDQTLLPNSSSSKKKCHC